MFLTMATSLFALESSLWRRATDSFSLQWEQNRQLIMIRWYDYRKICIIQGWDRKYLKKEEDNSAREWIDRAGGGCGRGAGHGSPPPMVGTFGISGINPPPPPPPRNVKIRGNPRIRWEISCLIILQWARMMPLYLVKTNLQVGSYAIINFKIHSLSKLSWSIGKQWWEISNSYEEWAESVKSQKGIITIQWHSFENQKGAIAIQKLWQ